MAFVSMFIVFLMLCAGILGLIFLLGIILIAVSAVRRRRARARGEQPKKAGLIAGIVLTVLPGLLIGGIALALSHGGREDSPDKISDALSSALTEGDSGAVCALFSEYARSQCPALETEVGGMLELFGGSITGSEKGFPSETCEKYADDGSCIVLHFEGEFRDAKSASGKVFYIRFFGYSRYEGDPDMVGLECITASDGETRIAVGMQEKYKDR